MRLFILLGMFLSFNLHAAEVFNIVCERADVNNEYEFSMVGTITVASDGVSTTSQLEYQLKNRGNNSSYTNGFFNKNGSLKVWEAGTILVAEDVLQFQFVEKNSPISYLNILANYPKNFSSKLRTKSGLVYKAKCFIN